MNAWIFGRLCQVNSYFKQRTGQPAGEWMSATTKKIWIFLILLASQNACDTSAVLCYSMVCCVKLIECSKTLSQVIKIDGQQMNKKCACVYALCCAFACVWEAIKWNTI